MKTYRAYVAEYGGAVLARVFCVSMLFGLWLERPPFLAALIPTPIFQWQPNLYLCGALGYMADSLLDKALVLLKVQAEVPRRPGPDDGLKGSTP